MCKESAIKTIRKTIIGITLLSVLLIIISISLFNLAGKSNIGVNNLSIETHEAWSKNTKNYLKNIQTSLELAIEKGEVDPFNDEQLQLWLTHNMELLTMESNIESFSAIGIGYGLEKDLLKLDIILKDNSIDDDNTKTMFRNEYKKIIQGIGTKTQEDILKDIESVAREISKNSDIPYEVARNIIAKCIVDDTNVIFSTAGDVDVDSMTVNRKDSSLSLTDKDGNSIWVESVIIPDGILGFFNEPNYVSGENNLHFRKIALCISVKENSVTAPLSKYLKDYKKITNISLFLLTVIAIASILIITIIFKNLLKLNIIGGDNYAINDCQDSSHNNNSNTSSSNNRTK